MTRARREEESRNSIEQDTHPASDIERGASRPSAVISIALSALAGERRTSLRPVGGFTGAGLGHLHDRTVDRAKMRPHCDVLGIGHPQ